MRRLRIEQLNLRVSRSVGGDPRALAHAVAQSLLSRLHRDLPSSPQPQSIDNVTVSTIRLPKHLSTIHSRHDIAANVARSVSASVQQSQHNGQER